MNKNSLSALLPILFSFFVMGFVDIVGISVSYVKTDFGLNDSMVNLLPMMVFLWFGLCSIPVGMLMRRIGRKNTVLISAVVTFPAMLLPLVSYTFPSVLLAFALLGIGNTILQVSLNPLVSNVVPSNRLTSTLTFGQFVKAICSASGPVLVAFFAFRFSDWKLIFALYAVILVLSFLWLWLIPIEEDRERNHSKGGIGVVLSLLRDKKILILWSIIVLIVGFEVGLMTTTPKYFIERGLSLEEGSYANTLYFIARTIGTFLGSFLLSRVNQRSFSIVTLVGGVSSLALFILFSDLTGLYVSLFFVGLFCANVFPIAFSQAIQYRPDVADEISSLMIVGVAGGALIPPVMGVLSDLSNQQTGLIIPLATLVYILIAAIATSKPDREKSPIG